MIIDITSGGCSVQSWHTSASHGKNVPKTHVVGEVVVAPSECSKVIWVLYLGNCCTYRLEVSGRLSSASRHDQEPNKYYYYTGSMILEWLCNNNRLQCQQAQPWFSGKKNLTILENKNLGENLLTLKTRLWKEISTCFSLDQYQGL